MLDCVVSKIHSFAPIATELTSRIDNVEVSHKEHFEELDRQQKQVKSINQRINKLDEIVSTKVKMETWQEVTDKLMAQLDDLQQTSTETQKHISQLRTRGVSLESSHRAHVAKLESATNSISEDIMQLEMKLMVH